MFLNDRPTSTSRERGREERGNADVCVCWQDGEEDDDDDDEESDEEESDEEESDDESDEELFEEPAAPSRKRKVCVCC